MKLHKANSINGYSLFEFALASALLTTIYFGFSIPNELEKNKVGDTKLVVDGVIHIAKDISSLTSLNRLTPNPMAVQTLDDVLFEQNNAEEGYSALSNDKLKQFSKVYFKNGVTPFKSTVDITSNKQYLQISTDIPRNQCIRYTMKILGKHAVYGVIINDQSEKILHGVNDTVARVSNECLSKSSASAKITTVFCSPTPLMGCEV